LLNLLRVGGVCDMVLEYAYEWQGVPLFAIAKKTSFGAWRIVLLPNHKIATAPHGSVIDVWDFRSGRHLRTLHAQVPFVYEMTLWDDSLVSVGDRFARVWDVDTGACLSTLPHPDAVNAVVVFRSLLCTGCADGAVRMWDHDSCVARYGCVEGVFRRLRDAPGCQPHAVYELHELRGPHEQARRDIQPERPERNEVSDLVVFGDTKLAVNFKTKTVVYAWNGGSFTALHETEGTYPDEMVDLGETFVMYNTSVLHVWTHGVRRTIPCVEILTMCALHDGRIATSGYDGRVRVYDTRHGSGQCEMFDQGPNTLYDMTYNLVQLPDGRLAGSKDNCVVLWDAATGRCVRSIAHTGAVTFLMAVGPGLLVGGDTECCKHSSTCSHCGKLSLLE